MTPARAKELFEIDLRSPGFARDMLYWSFQMQSEVRETVAATRVTIATSKALLLQMDRLLARR
jgi:hypothetical protein